jgi:RHS repeat-associated protein
VKPQPPLAHMLPPRRSGGGRRHVIVATVAVLVASLLPMPAPARAAAESEPTRPAVDEIEPVPVTRVKAAKPAAGPPMRTVDTTKPAPVWPTPGVAVVDVPAARTGTSLGEAGGAAAPSAVPAGTLPVRVAAVPATTAADTTARPGRLRVELLDRTAARTAGVSGLVLRVGRADGSTAAGSVRLTVDYRRFATAYGADWASRLRLVALPECALSKVVKAQCGGRSLPSDNDLAAKTVTATVPVGGGGGFVALTSGESGPAGDYAATSLQPSSTWSAGGNSGAFTWSYPMRVPPAVGGPAPQVALSYSSQSVDGRHAASNNQPSWVGEGFEAWPGGFIERRYRACSKDMENGASNTTETGDLCWATDNATLSLGGRSGELLYNATQGRWHLRGDDASHIRRETGAVNGDDNGEHWVVTTADGTEFWFGRNRLPGWTGSDPVTNSTWTVPVFGNHDDEPCEDGPFADSDCDQAWRWNLDHVVDVHGNSASYWYDAPETNRYGRNNDPDDAALYHRGGTLDHIAYGTRTDAGVDSVLDNPAPAQVVFGVANRCLSGCATHDEVHWPDTPWDSDCSAAPCNFGSPTFWTTHRLSTVTTQVWGGSSYRNVDRWTLTHTFPDPGDTTRAGLWLSKISHEGLVGTTTTVPDVEFTGTQLSNRVDTIDFAAAMNWWRISVIRNETGGTLSVNYSAIDCVAGTPMPTPHTNTRRCYPVRWTPEGYPNPVTDWFHKYVVTTIYEVDNTGGLPPLGSPNIRYQYSYLDGAAWRYTDDDGIVDPDDKTWSQWRGYARVGVTVGEVGEQTYTETRYLRGMHGDKLPPPTNTRTVMVSGTGVPDVADEDAYAGMTRESTVFNGPGGTIVSRTVHEPWQSHPTATRSINGSTVYARFTGTEATHSRIALDGGRPDRVTTVRTTFDDDYGMPIRVDDLGGTAPGDESCTTTDYEPRNTTDWLIDKPHSVRRYAVDCDTVDSPPTPLTEAQVIGESRTWYDGNNFDLSPTRGLPTRTQIMSAWNSGSPTFVTTARATYDSHGRVTEWFNAINAKTTTGYTPATGGPVTGTTVTNPLSHVTTATLEPAWGIPVSTVDPNLKRTDLAYDGLGRLVAVWLPNRDKSTQTANLTFAYDLNTDAATSVSTSRLNHAGDYVTSHALYDGLLRPRQTQRPSPAGARILTDTFYDTLGRQVKTYHDYYATGTPSTELVTATQAALVPNQDRLVYDGAGRTTQAIFQPYDATRWSTLTYYGGDRTDTTPPDGGTATSTVTDARGRTIELRQYHGPTPTPGTAGSWDATTYTYDPKGQLAQVSDPAGNDWTYTYDLRGRQTQVADPDKGTTTYTYDNLDRIATATDARGDKLAYFWDALNRKRAIYENVLGGPQRAGWTYDTLQKGHLTQSIRHVGTAAYSIRVTGYTDLYQPVGTEISIPSTEIGLGGIYTTTNNWAEETDGTLEGHAYPSPSGDLPSETISLGYDALGLPTTLDTLLAGTSSQKLVVDTDYGELGRLSQIILDTDDIFGGGIHTTFTHELETGRLTRLYTARDTAPTVLAEVYYSYDDAGNITKAADIAPDPVDDTQCFGYDHLRRLTQAWTPGTGSCTTAPSVAGLGGPVPYWHSWTFDNVGNRLTQTVHTSSGDNTTNYTYPAAGAPQPHTLTSTTGAETGSYTYDPAGNTLTRPTPAGTQNLTWDKEGRLATSTDTTGTTTYIYDADGNRLIRRDPTGTTLYLPNQELRYNTATTTTSATRYYTHAGQVVASRTAAGLTWLASDHQGTTQIAVNQTTMAADTRRQTPYGNPRGTVPLWPNNKGFVGGTNDNTGLTHLGAREYDPTIGRFISVDPIMDMADPQQWQAYSYSNNSPITFSDPSGLSRCDYNDCVDGSVRENHGGCQDGMTVTCALTNTPAPVGQKPAELKWMRENGYTGPDNPNMLQALEWASQSNENWDYFCQAGLQPDNYEMCATNPFNGDNMYDDDAVTAGWIALGITVAIGACILFWEACLGAATAAVAGAGEFVAGGTAAAAGIGALTGYLGLVGARMAASEYAALRAGQLASQIPKGSAGRVTMGVGVIEDAAGNRIVVIATSEPRGYIRKGVTILDDEIVIPGTGHAEDDIMTWAAANGYTVEAGYTITIGATRPVCPWCVYVVSEGGGMLATPVRPFK